MSGEKEREASNTPKSHTRKRPFKGFTLSPTACTYIEKVASASGRSQSAVVDEAILNHMSRFSDRSASADKIDSALAFAIRAAFKAAQWSLVAQLASELEARQTDRAMSS